MNFISFFLKRSLIVNLITFFVILIGSVVAINMSREAFPTVDFGQVTIVTVYPGASPKEVELYVTNRIEEEIENISRIDNYLSTSKQGLSFILIKLDPDLSQFQTKTTINEIQRAVDRVRNLPEEIKEAPLVKEIDTTVLPLMEIGITGNMPYEDLHQHTDNILDIIKGIQDAAKPKAIGFYDREFWVELDPKKLQKHHIGLSEVILKISAKNINLPAGVMKSEEGDYIVRTIGELGTAEEIDRVVIRSSASGKVLQIKDVGKTRASFKEGENITRTNGKRSINISITKKSQGDILTLVDQVKDKLSKYKDDFGKGNLEISYANDLSRFVRNRLGVLYNNGIVGIILVILCLLIFLSRGIAFVTALGMPLALLGAIITMSVMGMTINLLTMFGLVIVLGILVDDAIIVAENIWQHYENGKSPWEATVAGTSEVFWPVTATILTTIAAFSPLLMMSGLMGKFIASLPTVIIICLVFSLIESMFILPSHAYDVLRVHKWMRRKKNKKEKKTLSPIISEKKTFASILNVYERILKFIISFRYIFVVLCIALFASTLFFVKNHMRVILFPEEGTEAFFLRATLPMGTPKEVTEKKILAFEELAKKLPKSEVSTFITYVGRHQQDAADPLGRSGSHLAQIGFYLTPDNKRKRSANEIVESLRIKTEELSKSAGIEKISFVKLKGGPPVGKPVAVRIYSKNVEELKLAVKEVKAKIATLVGIKDIDSTPLDGKEELRIKVNDKDSSRMLTSTRDIALHVRATLEGQTASYISDEKDRIPIRVRYNKAARDNIKSIKDSKLINKSGQLIPLYKVAKLENATGLATIRHYNGRRFATVTASIDEKLTSSTQINNEFEKHSKSIEKKLTGVDIVSGGEYEDTTNSMESLKQAFFIALCLIFIILVAQFRSLTQPFVVMMAIPFGLVGIVFSFYTHGIPLSFLGLIGGIGLTGVVVNDSIVLVDFINKAREKGMTVLEAVIYGSRRRFRAVFLTSITTIAGLLPLAYGIGGYDLFLRPAAMALGYGLFFASFLILSLVPALYIVRIDIFNILIFLLRPFAKLFGGNIEKIKIK